MHHHNGSYIMFGDMNAVKNEQERVGSIFNNIKADHFNSFIDATAVKEFLTLLFSKNGAGGCSLPQMIFRLRSLKLFMVMKVASTTMAVVSRVVIGQVNIEVSEDTCVWSLVPKGTFTVKDARNIIDQKTLPSLAPSTT
ncbi:hypothetical protein Tco_0167560 [Tanacetum coccineum]